MIYGSVCSGIEAATVAWEPLGWKPAWFSEIEKFPCSVLEKRHPGVPNFGDMNKLLEREEVNSGAIELLVGGTPCQSFSVAGLRTGMDDPRGNLALVFLGIVDKLRPRWVVWENVPGVLSSNKGRDFGSFLGGLAELGYGFSYRVLDAQYFGLAQRRKRVFVIGHFGDWRPTAAVLFELESLSWNPAPSREAGKEITGTIVSRASGGGGGPEQGDGAATGFLITHSLTKRHDSSEYGSGRGTPIVISPPLISGPSSRASHGKKSGTDREAFVPTAFGVRRLTPRECERLQGFPDDYTLIAGKTADGPRYKALGNSMAVPVMRWIGRRIDAVNKNFGGKKEC